MGFWCPHFCLAQSQLVQVGGRSILGQALHCMGDNNIINRTSTRTSANSAVLVTDIRMDMHQRRHGNCNVHTQRLYADTLGNGTRVL